MYRVFCFLMLAFLALPAHAKTLFYSSVTSNDIDYIKTSDKSAFSCLGYVGRTRAEMPDKRGGPLFADGVYAFRASYSDGTQVSFFAHPDFGSQKAARAVADPVAKAVGKLPTLMRRKLSHVVLHRGDRTAFAESEGHFFVMYSSNIRDRISTRDLEETVFHESVHATLDAQYLRTSAWKKAQRADRAYLTGYAKENPKKEDMAEHALIAWAMIQHPGRLPAEVEAAARTRIPARLAFFEALFGTGPVFVKVGPRRGC